MKKIGLFSEMYILQTTTPIYSNLVCKMVYIEGIKYVNLIEISPVVKEIWGVENDDLVSCATHLSLPLTHDRVFDLNVVKYVNWKN